MKNFTKCLVPRMGILTSRPPCVTSFPPHIAFSPGIYLAWPYSHLTSTSYDRFQSHMGILTLCSPCVTISHLAWTFSPCIHLVWSFLTLHGMGIFISQPPCVHLVWPFPTLCGYSHLVSTSYRHSHLISILCDHILTSCDNFQPCMDILTWHPPCMTISTFYGHSHLTYKVGNWSRQVDTRWECPCEVGNGYSRWMWDGNSHVKWLCKSIYVEISENLHHLHFGHHWGNISSKVTWGHFAISHGCEMTLGENV